MIQLVKVLKKVVSVNLTYITKFQKIYARYLKQLQLDMIQRLQMVDFIEFESLDTSFDQIKTLVVSPTIFPPYDPNRLKEGTVEPMGKNAFKI